MKQGCLLVFVGLMICTSAANADEALEKRVEDLEKKLQAKEAATPAMVTAFGGIPIVIGAFVDTYYAYDFDEPLSGLRSFTTQPLDANAFNVNLAFIDVRVSEEKYRGRLALQAGTSVDANYAAEPSEISKHIQEAYVGYSPLKDLWIDAGIYFSHIGLESFISRDNWTYSRSLAADYTPYYQTGVRLSYQWCKEFSSQFHVLNGWQNIADNNSAKAVGAQLAFQPDEHLSVTYNNFLGKETGDEMRFFNDFVFKVSVLPVEVAFVYDIGLQESAVQPGNNYTWQTFTLIGRYTFSRILSFAVRGERFIDKDQVIVVTNTPDGFQVWGASANLDAQLTKNVVWRTEYRHFWSKDAIYPSKSGPSTQDSFVVTSLALSF